MSTINVNFKEFTLRLRGIIKNKIDAGEFSERSMARVLNVSQPHLHNVLKGVRRLNVDFADHLLRKFNMDILDLLNDEEIIKLVDSIDLSSPGKPIRRKSAARAADRESDPRAPWRTGS